MNNQNQYQNNMNRNSNSNYNNYENTRILITIATIIMLLIIFKKDGMSMLYSIPALLIALSVHEASHAFVANKYGDNTSKGRISLNPFKHIDMLGLLSLLTIGVGWGKPVSIDPRNFSGSKKRMDQIEAKVAFAGPLSNIVTAFIFSLIMVLCIKIGIITDTLYTILLQIVITNIGLGLFNLIPIPPMDGYKVFRPLLSENIKTFLDKNEGTIGLIWIFIIASGINLNFISVGIKSISTFMFKLWYTIFGIV